MAEAVPTLGASVPMSASTAPALSTADPVAGSDPAVTAPTHSDTSPAPLTRHRGESNVSFASVASTLDTSSVSPKRQDELERYFGKELKGLRDGPLPEDYLTVVMTQSADLQAKVLLHGRLYLTPYHLCFRSNILGYKTETIHPLTRLTSVRKGTTAKWIQNAVYIIEEDHQEGDYIGYGSMADRDAMFQSIVECWKVVAPERHQAWLSNGSQDTLVMEDRDVGGEVKGEAVDHPASSESKIQSTKCSGEGHLDELAIDTVIPIPLDQLFNLVYHNRAFIEEFYKVDKGLTASLKDKPATRMYCTTQCDWSSGSWLKSTITPAVIKGQKEHHQQLTKKIREWIKARPDEFSVDEGEVDSAEESTHQDEVDAGEKSAGDTPTPPKSLVDHALEIPSNPVSLGMAGLCLLLLLTLVYQWTAQSAERAPVPVVVERV
ncbi:hypothetical protein IAU60_005435 [Kwoniella sp. DSM 27419]